MNGEQSVPLKLESIDFDSTATKPRDRVMRASWYALFIMTLIHSTHYLDRIVVSIVIEPIRHEFGLSDSQLGLLTGLVYGLTFAVAGLPLGYLVDRVNRRNLLAMVVLCWSCFTAFAAFAQSFSQLLLARMAVGAAEAGGSPTSMSMISDLFPPRKRSTAMGVLFLSTSVGAAGSAIIGSYVAVHYGWRAAFLIAGLPGAIFASILLLTVKEPLRGAMDPARVEPKAMPSLKETARFLIGQKSLRHLFIAMPLAIMAISANSAWLVAFLMRVHHLDLAHASIVAGITFGGFSAAGSILGGLLSDRVGKVIAGRRIGLAATTSLLAVPVAVAATLVENTPLAIASWFILAMLAFSTIPPTFGSMVSLAKPRMRGITLAGMQVVTNLIGYGLAPFVVGMLSDLVGGENSLRLALLIVMCGSLLWAALHFYCASRHFEKDMTRAAQL